MYMRWLSHEVDFLWNILPYNVKANNINFLKQLFQARLEPTIHWLEGRSENEA